MFTEITISLKRARGSIIGWGTSLFLFGLMIIPIFESMAGQAEELEQLMAIYPEDLMAFLGDAVSFTTPDGFIALEFFSFIPLVLGIYVITNGSGMIAGDEEKGTLDLVAAHPISRSGLFFARLGSFGFALSIILVIAYAGIMIPTVVTGLDLDGFALMIPFVSMFAYLMVYGTFALLLSLVLPSRKMASMFSGMVLVADFFIQGLSNIEERLEPIANALPMTYFQNESWVVDGLNFGWLVGLLSVAVIFSLLAWWRYIRRDIRVAGEGGWEFPKLNVLGLIRGYLE